MSYNVQNTQFGIAFKPQAALQTANIAADFWKVSRANAGFTRFGLNTESDAAEVGKGSEFPTQVFPVSWDVAGSIEKYLSSEIAAWAFAFGLGNANMTEVAGTYTIKPVDVCDGLDMPAFSVLEQLGVGCAGGAAVDRAAIGCVINDWTVRFNSGPGRNNSLITVNFVGCGKTAEPSGIVMPATKLAEHELRGGSATVTINGTDYVAGKSLLSLEMAFRNNIRLDQGFFIGSGVQDNAAIRGRMERGNREYSLNFTARLEAASTEYAKLKAQTTGAATITLTNSATDLLTVTYHKVAYSAVDLADDNGIVTVNVQVTPLEDSTDGVLTATIKTAQAGIGATGA